MVAKVKEEAMAAGEIKVRVREVGEGYDVLRHRGYMEFKVKPDDKVVTVYFDDDRVGDILIEDSDGEFEVYLSSTDLIALKRILKRFKVVGE
jgi:hypothetical protein